MVLDMDILQAELTEKVCAQCERANVCDATFCSGCGFRILVNKSTKDEPEQTHYYSPTGFDADKDRQPSTQGSNCTQVSPPGMDDEQENSMAPKTPHSGGVSGLSVLLREKPPGQSNLPGTPQDISKKKTPRHYGYNSTSPLADGRSSEALTHNSDLQAHDTELKVLPWNRDKTDSVDSPVGSVCSVRSDGSFNPSSNLCTPQLSRTVSYKNLEERRLPHVAPPSGMVDRPNHEDSLRRVACVIHRHLVTCEDWYSRVRPCKQGPETAQEIIVRKRAQVTSPWKIEKAEIFREDLYTIPQYKYTFLRTPLGLNTSFYRVQQVPRGFSMPTVQQIHDFLHTLFTKAYLSSECSIVCLIYVEKLMEKGDIPILCFSWRPILLAGLLLASKVWQDLSTWNVEFNTIYPEFMLEKINILEGLFLKYIKWDLYISSKLYAKYYFALRAITEKKDFRRRYALIQNNINPPHADKVAQRTKIMKDDFAELLSKSL